MRMTSPIAATTNPARQLAHVGSARTRRRDAPSRIRAAHAFALALQKGRHAGAARPGFSHAPPRDSILGGRHDLCHADVLDARLRQPAPSLVMAEASLRARDRDVVPAPMGRCARRRSVRTARPPASPRPRRCATVRYRPTPPAWRVWRSRTGRGCRSAARARPRRADALTTSEAMTSSPGPHSDERSHADPLAHLRGERAESSPAASACSATPHPD